MQELEQKRIVRRGEEGAAGPINALGDEMAVHVGPGVGDIAGAKARDPGAEHQLDEDGGKRDHAP